MKVPANAIAETVEQLKVQNESLQNQIVYIQDLLDKNKATLIQLEPLAEWTEVAEPAPIDLAEPPLISVPDITS